MIAPIQMFDVNAINSGMQAGMQRGAVNSPFTPLGQALDGTTKKYEAGIAAQREQQNALALKREEFALGTGNKLAYADMAKKAADALRAKSGIEEGILYQNGARFMLDPVSGNRTLISNVNPDEARGSADWSSWTPFPQDNPMDAIRNKAFQDAGIGAPNVLKDAAQQVPVVTGNRPVASNPNMPRPIGSGTKDQVLMDLLNKL